MNRYIFVTGTDTGVGKTEFTVAFTRILRAQGMPAVALKPLSTGDRSDAERLQRAMGGALPLDWINPWAFAAPVAPLLAARREGRSVAVEAVLRHIRETSKAGDPVIVEGAGGLLSPFLKGADAPELIEALGARPVIVATNALGVVSRVRLVWHTLPSRSRKWAQVVLMEAAEADDSVSSNRELLGEYIPPRRIHGFPRLTSGRGRAAEKTQVGIVVAAIAEGLGLRG